MLLKIQEKSQRPTFPSLQWFLREVSSFRLTDWFIPVPVPATTRDQQNKYFWIDSMEKDCQLISHWFEHPQLCGEGRVRPARSILIQNISERLFCCCRPSLGSLWLPSNRFVVLECRLSIIIVVHFDPAVQWCTQAVQRLWYALFVLTKHHNTLRTNDVRKWKQIQQMNDIVHTRRDVCLHRWDSTM